MDRPRDYYFPKHDCGDPMCDGEALTFALKACEHGAVLYIRPGDPFHRVVMVGTDRSGDTAWCLDCGSLRVDGRWIAAHWFDTWKPLHVEPAKGTP